MSEVKKLFLLSGDWQVQTFTAPDGAQLRAAIYLQAPKPLSSLAGAVVFLTGRNEYIEKYMYLAPDLALPENWAFLTWDHRGQGASSGQRSYIDSYDTYAHDAQFVIQQCLPAGLPYVIVAHSMGSLITLYAYGKGLIQPQKAVLCSPFLGVSNEPFPKRVTELGSRFLTFCGFGKRYLDKKPRPYGDFAGNPLTHSEAKYLRMLNSPYRGTAVTFGWVAASLHAQDYVFSKDALARLDLPLALFGSEEDTVVDNADTLRWIDRVERFGPRHIHSEFIPGARHELFSETQDIYESVVRKLRAQLDFG